MRASLDRAVETAKMIGYVYLTTADRTARPHMCIVQPLDLDQAGRLALMAWFCQNTLQNLQENPKVSVVVWDQFKDTGYQLSGTVDDMEAMVELDGYAAGLEEKRRYPQVEWKVLVRVEHVLNFQKAPHIDVEV